jgi:hypothetical protein
MLMPGARRQPVIYEGGNSLLSGKSYDNKHHCNPHNQSSASPLAEYESQDTSREAAKTVNRDDDILEPGRWVVKCIQEILVAYNTAEDTLVVAE